MEQYNLVKNTLDQIPQVGPNARHIVGLVKEGGRITGYKLSDETFVSKPEAVSMAKQGQIAGVGIAHRGDTEYLKSIPNGNENDNLGNLPSVSPESQASLIRFNPASSLRLLAGIPLLSPCFVCNIYKNHTVLWIMVLSGRSKIDYNR